MYLIISIIKIIFILSLFGSVIGIADIFYRYQFNNFIIRKLAHLGCGFVSATMPFILSKEEALCVGFLLILLVIISKLFEIFSGVESADKDSLGTLFFPIGIIMTIIFFWDINIIIFCSAMMILGLADSYAAIIGKYYGVIKYHIFSNKTLEGTLTFALMTLVVMSIVYFFNYSSFGDLNLHKTAILLIGPLFLSMVEALSVNGLDNITIPLLGGGLVYLLMFI